MANIYFILLDVTRKSTDQQQMKFIKVSAGQNILDFANWFAEDNGTDIDNIRLYVAESMKVWDRARQDFIKGAYFRDSTPDKEPLFG